MKKAILIVLILICILSVFCSCSLKNSGSNTAVSSNSSISSKADSTEKTESNNQSSEQIKELDGVPASIVLRNVSIPENETYEIIHNYDSTTYIDDVELITIYSGKFGIQTKKYTYSYQYNRSTDLWSLISGNNGKQSDVINFVDDVYLNKEFTGKFNRYHSGSYSVTIKDIDFDNKKVEVDYLLTFDDNSGALFDIKTFELRNTNTGELCFVIPYKRSMVVSFEQVFVFDIDKGLYAE